MSKTTKIISSLALLIAGAVFLFLYPDKKEKQSDAATYYVNQGYIFGTYYNIRYKHNSDLHDEIKQCLQTFDYSLSTFNAQSTISKINTNLSDTTDAYFNKMYIVARKVSECSNGAFDITVAPLVNLWGFGFEHKDEVSQHSIDSILAYVGYRKITLEGNRLHKADRHIMLDASAVAKGYSCDVVAEVLKQNGIGNYLVDIGGEVVCNGLNDSNKPWAIGINKPTDDLEGTNTDLQTIIHSVKLAMATSGNYRQFYYDNGVRRSHTIDPRTGYPVSHTLLSATVIAPTCAEADALATACMVLGADEALRLINSLPQTECYLISSAQDSTQYRIDMTEGMKKYLKQL